MSQFGKKGSDGKIKHFFTGKGFYIALAFCLVGAGVASWIAVDKTLDSLTDQSSVPVEDSQSSSQSRQEWSFASQDGNEDDKTVGKNQEGVSRSSAESGSSGGSSSASSSSSSSQQQSASSDNSEQQTLFNQSAPSAYVLPIDGEVFNGFSNGELVKNETLKEWRTHDGIDIKAEQGAQVLAVADGKVSKVYKDQMWGTVVEITHGGKIVSYYYGLGENVLVKEGDKVEIKTPVGTLGNTNLAESAMDSHLHFGMKQDGKWVDPMVLMDKVQK